MSLPRRNRNRTLRKRLQKQFWIPLLLPSFPLTCTGVVVGGAVVVGAGVVGGLVVVFVELLQTKIKNCIERRMRRKKKQKGKRSRREEKQKKREAEEKRRHDKSRLVKRCKKPENRKVPL